jgi:diguanylate cyclase (GGDEF)-like protein
LTITDSIRARYPHETPVRESFASDAEYTEAVLRYFKGQAELTEGFFSAIPFAAVTTLGDGAIAYANSMAQQLFGLTPADWPRHRATEFLHDAEGNPVGEGIGKRVAGGEVLRQEAVYVRRPDGRHEMRLLSIAPVFMPGTRNLARAIGLFQDPGPLEHELESLRVLNRTLRESFQTVQTRAEEFRVLAYTDDMTGLMNKRAFSEMARPAIEEARRKNTSIGLFFFDPDCFKERNDTYGHAVGDELIREIAIRLREVAERHGGTVARFGGDEFYALFQGKNAEELDRVAQDFAATTRFTYEAENLESHREESFELVLSIGGVLRIGSVIPDLGPLLKEADKAMFESKRSGRGPAKEKPYVLRLPRLASSLPPTV